ncbi:UV damage endonuclease [Emydomyces testavorans]|uniref:UV damage endonuclease n=1 Tax=Emydomyces testavorans TaxID=2070801 RepID=A0AAF0DDV7_9EURO|nr:UV damage endonuclease [Emydomyces testavorans]
MARAPRRSVVTRNYKIPDSDSESSLYDAVSDYDAVVLAGNMPASSKFKADVAMLDPEEESEVPAEEQEVREAVSRPPPDVWATWVFYYDDQGEEMRSDCYHVQACLCTYLRSCNPPVFSSRTCRIASILENRHPLKDPSQPAHPTKNRPDREQSPDVARGEAYVQALGLANARDIVKMLRWNDRFGIRFMRLSSEMFPFASHAEYGYKLAPFASEALADAGQVAAELGHRLSVHPGQIIFADGVFLKFTQLGSPRREVIESSIRDLEYHAEMLNLLKLPPQQDRDAVMILHMGGSFGDKQATLERFKGVYQTLSEDIKKRLVLENDDVNWTVHDLLPVCEELGIPLVLDYHHHNINFDADKIREGTLDIMNLYDRIKATWTKKGITQKMHYSEPTPSAITKMQRRKHSPRVQMLPPCDPAMDLMIEAKDKEQAVFDLMKTYKLPGFEKLSEIIPHVRPSELEDGIDMGGPEGRVYWPPGMEHWLRPEKRAIKRKAENGTSTTKRNHASQSQSGSSGVGRKEVIDNATKPARKRTAKTKAKKS